MRHDVYNVNIQTEFQYCPTFLLLILDIDVSVSWLLTHQLFSLYLQDCEYYFFEELEHPESFFRISSNCSVNSEPLKVSSEIPLTVPSRVVLHFQFLKNFILLRFSFNTLILGCKIIKFMDYMFQ
jgi:hypothetical protein